MLAKVFILMIAFCAVALPFADAWGEDAHRAIALLVRRLLPPKIKAHVDKLLTVDGQVQEYGEAANWADKMRIDPKHAYTTPFHIAKIPYAPNEKIELTPKYFESTKTIFTGIELFTQKLKCDADPAERPEALKFLLHFLADMGQPLHITGYKKGATELECSWDGTLTNLHVVWDRFLPRGAIANKMAETVPRLTIFKYVDRLEEELKNGKYADKRASWTRCLSEKENPLERCTIEWLNNSKFLAEMILKELNEPKYHDLKLGEEYLETHKTNIDFSFARIAVRTAAYLDYILSPCS
ncbi:S1/P1 nuclease [Syncephalis fuscata]|nr:S1/P1 nuclease [Syncephalis fuscata]